MSAPRWCRCRWPESLRSEVNYCHCGGVIPVRQEDMSPEQRETQKKFEGLKINWPKR